MNRPRAKLLLAGLAVFVAGLAYAAVFAGIPYQDPTPAMQASWSLHMRIGDTIMTAGAAMIAFAILALAASALARWIRPRKPPPE